MTLNDLEQRICIAAFSRNKVYIIALKFYSVAGRS